MMVINNEFEIGQIVYLKTDTDQLPRIIIAIIIYKAGEIMYKLITETKVSDHYGFELTEEVNNVLKTIS